MKRRMNKALCLKLIPLLALTALFAVGASYAWPKRAVSVENNLKAHMTDVSIIENFNKDDGTKEVSFMNQGDSSVFLRMSYVEYWETEGGEILSSKVDGKDVAAKVWTDAYAKQWSKIEPDEGWFYYNQILKAGAGTDKILMKVTFPASYEGALTPYKDAEYHLYFQAEAVQASDGAGTLNQEEVNANATWKTWNRTASTDREGLVTWSTQAPAGKGGVGQ